MATVYGIKNCDTLKKARGWLDAHEIDYDFHDYKKSGIEAALLKSWVKQAGWEALINRRGTTWRKVPEAIRNTINQSVAIELMLSQPSIIRRPVLVHNKHLLVGFNPEEYTATLL